MLCEVSHKHNNVRQPSHISVYNTIVPNAGCMNEMVSTVEDLIVQEIMLNRISSLAMNNVGMSELTEKNKHSQCLHVSIISPLFPRYIRS